jgi:RNA polymerase sigma factor (TIGR02999 family)
MASSKRERDQGDGAEPAGDASRLLSRAAAGDEKAASRLLPLVYDELRRLAGGYLRRERPGQTLQATALVHEAYMRLVKPGDQPWTGRTHFLAIAAVSMRQVLVDRARRRDAAKRGGARQRITLDEGLLPAPAPDAGVDLVALDRALIGAGGARSAAGAHRGAALLRRSHRGRDGRGDGFVARHREAALDAGAGLPEEGAGRGRRLR